MSCKNCEAPIYRYAGEIAKSKSGYCFCTKKCAAAYNNQFRIGDKNPNYNPSNTRNRKRALIHYTPECSNINCDLRDIVTLPVELLEVHHKNGDRADNDIENLEVLCLYCHRKETVGIGLDVSLLRETIIGQSQVLEWLKLLYTKQYKTLFKGLKTYLKLA